VLSPTWIVGAIINPNGLLVYVLYGETIVHYPAIPPVTAVRLHPKLIDELPVLYTVLDILNPSAKLLVIGFIYWLPHYNLAYVVLDPALSINVYGIFTFEN
jgi:hypothetical protein